MKTGKATAKSKGNNERKKGAKKKMEKTNKKSKKKKRKRREKHVTILTHGEREHIHPIGCIRVHPKIFPCIHVLGATAGALLPYIFPYKMRIQLV